MVDLAPECRTARRIDQLQAAGRSEAAAGRAVGLVDEGKVLAAEPIGDVPGGAIGQEEEAEHRARRKTVSAVERAQLKRAAGCRGLAVGDHDARLEEAAALADPIDAERVPETGDLVDQREARVASGTDGQHGGIGAVDQRRVDRLAVGARRQEVEHRSPQAE